MADVSEHQDFQSIPSLDGLFNSHIQQTQRSVVRNTSIFDKSLSKLPRDTFSPRLERQESSKQDMQASSLDSRRLKANELLSHRSTHREQASEEIRHPKQLSLHFKPVNISSLDDASEEHNVKNQSVEIRDPINLTVSIIEKNEERHSYDTERIYDLQTVNKIINETEEFGEIVLPENVIKVGKLVIKKPIKFKGCASGGLEVSNWISIELDEYEGNQNARVIFSECPIYFEYGSKKFSLNQSISTLRSHHSQEKEYRISEKINYSDFNINSTKFTNGQFTTDMKTNLNDRFYPLFILNPGSVLELADCNISSKNLKNCSNPINDICFYINNEVNENEDPINSSLFVQSTYINDFFMTIQNDVAGNIFLEKVYISGSKFHALNISNPHIFEIKESVIDNTFKSCINLRFSKEVDSEIERRVIISNNELHKGSGYGISIFGENMKPHTCDIKISENKVSNFKKDGIGIKNLNISKIEILNNQIFSNSGNGIFLHNILDTANFLQVRLCENKIYQSSMYGLALTDVACYSERDQIVQNDKGGVIISGGEQCSLEEFLFYKKYPLRNIFNITKFNNNKDSGVIIVGALKGPFIFNSCEFYENTNGLYVKQLPVKLSNEQPPSSNTNLNLGDIVVEKCVLFQNSVNGIYIKNLQNVMFLRQSTIKDNRNFAIFIQAEDQKDQISFREKDKGKVRDHISGHVGGSWGLLYETNSNTCKGNRCSIF